MYSTTILRTLGITDLSALQLYYMEVDGLRVVGCVSTLA